jgi:hypothetical protein
VRRAGSATTAARASRVAGVSRDGRAAIPAPGEPALMRVCALLAALALLALAAPAARADVSGIVRDAISGEPIAGAVVSVRARPDIARVTTAADGSFVLTLQEPDVFEVAAAVAYDHFAAVNYHSDAQQAFDGMTGIDLPLQRLSTTDNPEYVPPSAGMCASCHSAYFNQWSQSRHAGAAQNPWVLDLFSGTGTPGGGAGYVFRDSHDPGDSGFCATCHAPLEDVFAPGEVMLDEVESTAGQEGVVCLSCHQIAHVNDALGALHHLGNTEYRFPLAAAQTGFHVFGPLPDVDMIPMQNTYSPLFEDSKHCAGCHEYDNPSTGVPGQTTYSEWLASPYAQPGPGYRTCQQCHMPQQQTTAPIAGGGPQRPGSQRHSHRFVGATPQTLSANIGLAIDVERRGDELWLFAEVDNQAGHDFPTGISIRNALLLLEVSIDGQPLPQLDGPVLPYWASDEEPGEQPGDHAGRPGKGFAKVLRGRINGQGDEVEPVLFIDAETTASDTRVPSGATDLSVYRFALPPQQPEGHLAQVDARLLYRRAWRALAVTKGWTQTPAGMPVEIEVQHRQAQLLLPGDNAPPVAIGSLEDRSDAEGDPVTIATAGHFAEPDGQPLTFSATGLPPGVAIDAVTGVIDGTLGYDAAGVHTVVVKVRDPFNAAAVQPFTWTVANTNRAPLAVGSIADQQHAEGEPVNLATAPAFVDPDGDPLAYAATGLPGGLAIDPASGMISGSADYDSAGVYPVQVTATDGEGASASQAFDWTIDDTNRAPLAIGSIPAQQHRAGQAVHLPTAAYFDDPDGDPLAYAAQGLPEGLQIDPLSGVISGLVSLDADGPHAVLVTASDPDGASADQAFEWTVTAFDPRVFRDGFEP